MKKNIKPNQSSLIFKIITWIVLLLIGGIIGLKTPGIILRLSLNGASRVSLKEMLTCPFIGGKMRPCVDIVPCGCYKVFADRNKPCTKPNQCLAGACIIEKSDKPQSDGLFIGKCPEGANPYNYDNYYLNCGEATIENGKIVQDERHGCYY